MLNLIVGYSHRKCTTDINDILSNCVDYVFNILSYNYIGSRTKEIFKFLIIFNIITFKFSLMIYTSHIEFRYSGNIWLEQPKSLDVKNMSRFF